ncbi:MAG: response regulator [bacterium]|nr:response regulator [bacterium]
MKNININIPFLIFFFWVLFSLASSGFALDPNKDFSQYMIDTWGREEGLPQNSVYAILRTRDGYLWLGTQEGLVRFDGVRFEVFDKRRVEEMSNNVVLSLCEDRENNLWVGTYGGGLSRMKDGKFTTYTTQQGLAHDIVWTIREDRNGILWIGTGDGLNRMQEGKFTTYTTEHGLPNDSVRAIHEDRKGNLWIGTEDNGLCLLRDGKFTTYTTRPTQQGMANDAVFSIHEDRNGNLWIGTLNGLRCLRDDRFITYTAQTAPIAPTPQKGLEQNTVWSIHEDLNGILWIGSEGGGLSRMQEGKFTTYAANQGMHNNLVWSLHEDRNGNLWIGTRGSGLSRMHDGKFTTYTTRQGLPNDDVWAIHEDPNGSLWFGTYGGGLCRMKDGKFTTYTAKQGLAHDYVWTIHGDRSGSLWIGTHGGGLSRLKNGEFTTYTTRNTKQGLSNDFVYAIHEDRNGNLWIGTYGGGLCRMKDGKFTTFTTKQGLAHDRVLVIHEDRAGIMWIGTIGGLSRMKNGQFTTYTTKQGLTHNIVVAIHEDRDGSLWLGTRGGGLSRMRNGQFKNITGKDGLFDDVVWMIIEDDRGDFWMSCNKGIFKVSQKELNDFCDGKINTIQCVSYDENDGMKSRECSRGSAAGLKSRDGKLWFPTIKGIVMIDPNNIMTNPIPPPVVIEKIITENETIEAPFLREGQKRVIFLPGKNEFEIQYTGLSLLVPERVLFKTRLEGYDTQWREVGTRRTAYYTNLSPGNYTFRVIACNNDGVWNKTGASVSFYLEPWFYQTGWFLALCVLAATLTIFTGYRLRVRQLKTREKALSQMVEDRTGELARQAEKLKEMDQVKSRFFANISHEFRTPLTLILGPLEQMISAFPNDIPKQEKKLTLMHRNAERLLRLINQLLELSKLDSGKMKLQARKTDIISFTKGITASFMLLTDQKELELEFHVEYGNNTDAEELFLWVDVDKMEVVLSNLLVNAFKFTPPGGEITVTLKENPSPVEYFPDGSVEISVRDTGPGIPADQVKYIFDHFYQAGAGYEIHQKGSGIGLALCKRLVELHHGTIEAKSKEGEGSKFIVRLPMGSRHLAPDEQGAPAAIKGAPADDKGDSAAIKGALAAISVDIPAYENETPMEMEETSPERQPHPLARPGAGETDVILVVEDSDDLRGYIRGALEPNYRVVEAPDGREGIDKALDIIPDLIISDIMMPHTDGYELCKALKTDVKTSHIPIILLTAKASEENILQGLETGADDYVTKPFSTKILNARIKNLVDIRKQLQININRELDLKPVKTSLSPIDREFLNDLHKVIDKNLSDEDFNVAELSKKLYMSRGHLHSKVKALSGLTPTEFIRSFRLKRGAELLTQNFGSVLEIALEVGFSSTSYFSKCFKEKFQRLPSHYQAANQG